MMSYTRRNFVGTVPVIAASVLFVPAAFAKPGESQQKHGSPGGGGRDNEGLASGDSKEKTSTELSSNAAYVLNDGDAYSEGTYVATQDDQSVFEASGNVTATLENINIQKESGDASSADGSSFYGINSAVHAFDNAYILMRNCTVQASAQNATGVFSYGNSTIEIIDSTVEVTGGGAGGVQVAGGGTLIGTNLTVTSASKAAIRSDRGGGTLDLTGGTYTSTGSNGCPAIYSTADITVRDAVCVSTDSRAVIIEGKNSVTVENCELSGNDQSSKEGSVRANVLLYQSASGDASVGTGVFTMKQGSMACNEGAMFYCTNTSSVVNLENAELALSPAGSLLIVSAGRWGKDGSNGGECVFNATKQTLEGTVAVDAISALELNLTEGSSFEGTINSDGTQGYVKVLLDGTSSWKLSADSYISEFEGDINQIDTNGFTLYVQEEALL